MFRIRSKHNIGDKKDYKVTYVHDDYGDVSVTIIGIGFDYKKTMRFRASIIEGDIDDYLITQLNYSFLELNGTEIIQNPFRDEEPPNLRPLANEIITINNGMQIHIKWFIMGDEYPDNAYSFVDSEGNELDVSVTGESKDDITRRVIIYPPNEIESVYYSTDLLDREYSISEYAKYRSNNDIIDIILEKWRKKTNSNVSTSLDDKVEYISYRNPITKSESSTPNKDVLYIKENMNSNISYVTNKDISLSFKITDDLGNLYDESGFIFTENTQTSISNEYLVDGFDGLDEQEYTNEEEYDDDDKTSDDSVTLQQIPTSGKNIDAISYSHKTIHDKHNSDNKIKGRCASFTWNKARIYVSTLKGLSSDSNLKPAGGNANGDGYHKNLQGIGYKKHDKGNLSTIELKQILNNQSNWSLGDVVVYWNTDGDKTQNCRKYGHTIMYTGGYASSKKDMWTTDNANNWGSGFCYNNQAKNGCNRWNLIIFKAPIFDLV